MPKIKPGIYQGTVTGYTVKNCKTKAGKEFQRFETSVAVELSDKELVTAKCSMSMEYAKKTIQAAKTDTKHLIGQRVECKVVNREFRASDESIHSVSEIAYYGIIVDGTPCYPPKPEKEKQPDLDF